MPPVPYPSWKGLKYTTKDSKICIQRDPFRRDYTVEGSEDCLYLNVYTPPLEDIKNKTLGVMVWFHGGGFECGSGISEFYGPDHLLDKDIIFVSGNFRVGPLGFLSTETLDCPGNNGLKDQVEILKWVQANIERFGGDRNKVTIFGESAGGASVTYHMLSPLSEGLFTQGIAQSGTYLNPWAQPAHKGVAASRSLKMARLLDCDVKGGKWPVILDCLRQKSAHNITERLYDFFEWDTEPMVPFPPVVEKDHAGAFLAVHPRQVDHSTLHSVAIPLMIGATTGEGALRSAAYLNTPTLLEAMKSQYEMIWPIMLNYDHHDNFIQQKITRDIDNFYFKNGHNYHISNHDNLTNLISDGWFVAGIDDYIKERLSSKNKGIAGPTFVYLFDQKASASFTEIFHGGKENYFGVSHAEELQYLFPIGKELFISSIPTKQELLLRDIMVELWSNFATYGNPTPDQSNLMEWTESTEYPLEYMKIGSANQQDMTLLQREKHLYHERCEFWRQLKAHFSVQYFKNEL